MHLLGILPDFSSLSRTPCHPRIGLCSPQVLFLVKRSEGHICMQLKAPETGYHFEGDHLVPLLDVY